MGITGAGCTAAHEGRYSWPQRVQLRPFKSPKMCMTQKQCTQITDQNRETLCSSRYAFALHASTSLHATPHPKKTGCGGACDFLCRDGGGAGDQATDGGKGVWGSSAASRALRASASRSGASSKANGSAGVSWLWRRCTPLSMLVVDSRVYGVHRPVHTIHAIDVAKCSIR